MPALATFRSGVPIGHNMFSPVGIRNFRRSEVCFEAERWPDLGNLYQPTSVKMKALLLSSYSRCIWRTAVLGLAITLPMAAADSPNWRLTPVDVLAVMHRVADWQLAHPSAHSATDWTQAAGDAGMMALVGISGEPKYRDALLAMGEANGWKPGPRIYHADDLAIGQTFAGLYLLYRDPKMIAPLRSRLEAILSAPPEV